MPSIWRARGQRRPSFWLGAALLMLVLQPITAVLTPQAEARWDFETTQQGAHLESEGSDACGVAHNHLLCVVGRTLDRALPGIQTGPTPLVPVLRSTPWTSHRVAFLSAADSPAQPRAPPLA